MMGRGQAIVTATGLGRTIGEARRGTTRYAGQIRVFEQLQYGAGRQQNRRPNEGSGGTRSTPPTRGGYRGSPESYNSKSPDFEDDSLESLEMGLPMGGGSDAPADSGRGSRDVGRAGIGLGDEHYVQHHDTGITYDAARTQPVISLQVEFSNDLAEIARQAWRRYSWSWFEPLPNYDGWWDEPWSWRRPLAGDIPVSR